MGYVLQLQLEICLPVLGLRMRCPFRWVELGGVTFTQLLNSVPYKKRIINENFAFLAKLLSRKHRLKLNLKTQENNSIKYNL